MHRISQETAELWEMAPRPAAFRGRPGKRERKETRLLPSRVS